MSGCYFYYSWSWKLYTSWTENFPHPEHWQDWVKLKSLSCLTLWLYSLWNSPGQNTGVSSLSLLQGTVPTQGLNLFPALWADSLPAEPQGTEIQGKFSQVFLGLFIWVLFSLVWGKVNCVSTKGLLPHLGKLFRSLWTCPMWSPWWCSHLIFWTSPSVLDFWKILLWNRLLV